MDIVCFDTQVLIWGIKKEANSSQQEMISRAEYLIELCEEQNRKILVPSIVLAELLVKVPVADHEQFIRVMERRFIVPPFDAQMASHFARIWQQHAVVAKGIAADKQATRQELKADMFIIATAVARKAWCIYSTDPHIGTFANGFVEVRDVPEVPIKPTQMDLFGDTPENE